MKGTSPKHKDGWCAKSQGKLVCESASAFSFMVLTLRIVSCYFAVISARLVGKSWYSNQIILQMSAYISENGSVWSNTIF